MSLTPLDIHHKEFAHALRGYDVGEVDGFLEEVKIELEKAQRIAAELAKRAEASEQRLAKYVSMEGAINNAFISAQQSADAIRASAEAEGQSLREGARSEGERVYREAETKAREIIREALAERERIAGEADRLQRSEDDFRTNYIALLDHFYAEANKKEFEGERIAEVIPAETLVEEASAPSVEEAPVFQEPVQVAQEEPVVALAAGMPAPVEDDAVAIDPFAPKTAPVVFEKPVEQPIIPEEPSAPPIDKPAPELRQENHGYSHLGEVEDDFEIEEID